MLNRTYAMPIEERDGGWRFRVMIDGRIFEFGPYSSIDSALAVRRMVVANPDTRKTNGGRLSAAYEGWRPPNP